MSETSVLECWRCGGGLAELSLPLSRRDECPTCAAELHVCKLCEFFDPYVAKQCREPVADEVQDKTRANFCGYFQPRPGVFSDEGQAAAAQHAREELAALFDEAPITPVPRTDPARENLERLFRKS